ncbi:hypothetical protein CGRA01v4_06754 [Colletotrichum graminicola]|nr:hypothetical protein CGRA01v4_06754 [Colletotrichum graminicola]
MARMSRLPAAAWNGHHRFSPAALGQHPRVNGLAVMFSTHLSSPASATSCKQARSSVARQLPSSLACCVLPACTYPFRLHEPAKTPAEPSGRLARTRLPTRGMPRPLVQLHDAYLS